MAERWHLNRAGLFNFWYYDDEEFNFADGKLLLRGSNGSGKSVTMQSLIPVLLDGRKTPERLDPFGSRARRMEDYLLGEKEVSEIEERTGYLYLEFKKGADQYLTIGTGLKAKRQSKLDSWYFVIWDNRRLGKDLFLYKKQVNVTGMAEKIPLSWKELQNRLADGGKVVRGQEEYMALVNRYLFGFKSLTEFNDLVRLLIQVRSPKLSKDFRPTVIFEILNESLPFLSDEELRPLTETIENMDQTKSQLDQMVREEQALSRVIKVYDQYNRKVRLEKAEGLLKSYRWLEERKSKLNREREDHLRGKEELKRLAQKQEDLQQEEKVLQEDKEALQAHDVYKAEKEKSEIERQLQEIQVKREKAEKDLNNKKIREQDTRKDIEKTRQRQAEFQLDIDNNLEEMEGLAEEAGFLNHEVAVWEFKQSIEGDFSFTLWQKEAKVQEEKLNQALEAFRAESQARGKHKELDRELGEARKEWEEAQFEERKWADVLAEEKKSWQENFFSWHQENFELKLEETAIQSIVRQVWKYPEDQGWDALRQPVLSARETLSHKLEMEKIQIKHALQLQEEKIQEVSQELQSWKQKKDPEPPRHPDTGKARSDLQTQGVPYIPFYAGVEFQENVPLEIRERLEAALNQSGILDALIVPESYFHTSPKVLKYDRILYPQPQLLAHTLADYLYATPVEGSKLSGADIDVILRSIIIEESWEEELKGKGVPDQGETSVSLQGGYKIGLLTGHAPLTDASIYIGRESRRRYRLKEINRLEEELIVLQNEKNDIAVRVEQLTGRLAKLEEEFNRLPSDQDLKVACDSLDLARRKVQQAESEVQRKDQKVKEALNVWEEYKAELREKTRTLTLPTNEEIYKEALARIKEYREYLSQIEISFTHLQATLSQAKIYQGNLEEFIQDVDELRGELNILSSQQSLMQKRLDAVERRLKEMGADEVRTKTQQVLKRLGELPPELRKCQENYYQEQSRQTKREEDIAGLEKEVEWAASLVSVWNKVFSEEEKIQKSFEQIENAENSAADKGDLGKQAQSIRQRILDEDKNLPDREELHSRLQARMFNEMGNLIEYRLSIQPIGSYEADEERSFHADEQGGEDELWQSRWQDLVNKARRSQLVMEYDGKKVSPYYVWHRIEADIELQKQILNDKDRELYEEIIMNSVGRIIRARIERAEHWVTEMNKLMAERDTSSGLKLAIQWKPRTAEHEDELDTQDLVELLKADPRLLKESDMDRITRHFRTKIERAKQVLEDRGYGESFHQIIKEMLDYRRWFSFSLRYQIEDSRWKELTDRAFYTFSGGEKAMAMYIPLFSAAYSRYTDAGTDAPRIISLDEAFAGVDEKNIRDMFDLVEKLGFDYIMNSQALWGDYDTVSRLAIVELVRPKNADFVTLIRYWWDGKVRHLVAK